MLATLNLHEQPCAGMAILGAVHDSQSANYMMPQTWQLTTTAAELILNKIVGDSGKGS